MAQAKTITKVAVLTVTLDSFIRAETGMYFDGRTVRRLTAKEVPVDGFWSISVYISSGFFEKNLLNAYSVNNLTATSNADGSFTNIFGGCDTSTTNCLPITKGWNYTVRLYRPRREMLEGT